LALAKPPSRKGEPGQRDGRSPLLGSPLVDALRWQLVSRRGAEAQRWSGRRARSGTIPFESSSSGCLHHPLRRQVGSQRRRAFGDDPIRIIELRLTPPRASEASWLSQSRQAAKEGRGSGMDARRRSAHRSSMRFGGDWFLAEAQRWSGRRARSGTIPFESSSSGCLRPALRKAGWLSQSRQAAKGGGGAAGWTLAAARLTARRCASVAIGFSQRRRGAEVERAARRIIELRLTRPRAGGPSSPCPRTAARPRGRWGRPSPGVR